MGPKILKMVLVLLLLQVTQLTLCFPQSLFSGVLPVPKIVALNNDERSIISPLNIKIKPSAQLVSIFGKPENYIQEAKTSKPNNVNSNIIKHNENITRNGTTVIYKENTNDINKIDVNNINKNEKDEVLKRKILNIFSGITTDKFINLNTNTTTESSTDSTTEDYETTTVDENDVANRSGAISSAAFATLLGG